MTANKVLQFPTNRSNSASGWGERLLCAATYGVLIVADASSLFSGELLPFMVAGLVYYAVIHHRRVRVANASFVRFHLLQALMLTTLIKLLLAVLNAVLALVISTVALIGVGLSLELTVFWLGYGALIALGGLLLYSVVMCAMGRQFRVRWVSDWVDRTI